MQLWRYILLGAIAIIIGLLGNLVINQIWDKASSKLLTPSGIAISIISFIILVILQLWIGWQLPGRVPAYFLTIVSDQNNFAAAVKVDATRYFEKHRIQRSSVDPFVVIGDAIDLDWARLLQQALNGLHEFKKQHQETHFVCAGFWLWNFALGAQLVDRHNFTLYHYQGSQFYPIWQGGNEIRERSNTTPYTPAITKATQKRAGNSLKAVVLLVVIGKTDFLPTAEAFVNQKYPDIPYWEFIAKEQLNPAASDQWRNLATDLAHTIRSLAEGGQRKVYLLGGSPAVIGLMAGTGVGRLVRLQLVQFNNVTSNYQEILQLPLKDS